MTPVQIIPAGHAKKSDLAARLRISTAAIQQLSKLPDFPAPAGLYVSQNSNRRIFPFYCIQKVKRLIQKHQDFKPAPPKMPRKASIENAEPWAVPAHSKKEREACLLSRQFLTLMTRPLL